MKLSWAFFDIIYNLLRRLPIEKKFLQINDWMIGKRIKFFRATYHILSFFQLPIQMSRARPRTTLIEVTRNILKSSSYHFEVLFYFINFKKINISYLNNPKKTILYLSIDFPRWKMKWGGWTNGVKWNRMPVASGVTLFKC